MKTLTLTLLLFVASFTVFSQTTHESQIISNICSVSVTIDTPTSTGSGTIFTRPDWSGTNLISFIWTVGHTVDDAISVPIMFLLTGPTAEFKRDFNAVDVIRHKTKNGEHVSKIIVKAKVIKFSDHLKGEDIAILLIQGDTFNDRSATFMTNNYIPWQGQRTYHVGSPSGEKGHNSFSRGEVSYVGRLYLEKLYDQTTSMVLHGSSGGGVFDEDGKYIGMISRMKGSAYNFMVPARRMETWAKDQGVSWAFDPTIPMPSEKEFKQIPIEDVSP